MATTVSDPITTTDPTQAIDPALNTATVQTPETMNTATPTGTITTDSPPNQTGMLSSVIPQPVNPTPTVAPAATASYQLNKLLSSDSPNIQSARSNGLSLANDRGMINSSIAAGASEKAAIDAAAPIAAQDASTYAAAGLSNQNANQQLNLTGYSGKINEALQAQQSAATLAQQTQQQQATAELQTSLKQMDVNLDLSKLTETERSNFSNAVSPIMTKYQEAYTAIQTQADSVLNASGKAKAIADLQATYIPQLQSISNIYGYNIDWGTPNVVENNDTTTGNTTTGNTTTGNTTTDTLFTKSAMESMPYE